MGSATFSSAVDRPSRLKFWKTKPIRRLRIAARSLTESVETSTSPRRYVPRVGWSRQPIRFMHVDLPEPDAPMIAKSSPPPDGERDAAQRPHLDIAEVVDLPHVAEPDERPHARSHR